MALQPGTCLGSYEVIALIGEGGMGHVYRAHDTRLTRDVALKILPDTFADDPERLARFQREARVLASLNHPNIAAIYGIEESNGIRALILELVEGPTLADRIAQAAIPIDEALPIARQIAEALETAHEQGVIHRDLKPANIKVRSDGTVKVLDFGLAKLAETTAASSDIGLTQSPTITTPAMMTGAGSILGTAAYMSPEQAKGRSADTRSDIWSFGCVLYEMLTGSRPFEGEDVAETLASVLRSEPDWTALPDEIPLAIRTLIGRCLAKDRRQRVGNIAVAQFVLAEPTAPGAPGTASAVSTPLTSRAPRWPSIIAIAATVLVTGVLVAAASWKLGTSSSSATVARFSVKLPENQQLTVAARQLIDISPDGSELVYVANNRLFLRPISELDAHAIPGTEQATGVSTVHSPAFSPDGRSLAFYVNGGLMRIAVTGGTAVTVCSADAPFGLTWDASGIIFGQGPKGILRCSPNGGTPEQLAVVKPDEQAQRPEMLPGGGTLLFTVAKAGGGATRWDQAQIVAQSLKSGERKTVLTGGSDGRYLPTGQLLYAIGGVVLAVPFDARRLEITGGATPVLEGVARARGATTGVAHLAVARSGALAYLSGPTGPTNSQREVALADRAGAASSLKLPAAPYAHVRVSRDGKRAALGSDDAKDAIVWIYDLSGTNAIRRLTLEGKNRYPIWSPDHERVAFQSDREGDLAIFAQRADGSGGVERLTTPVKGEAHLPGSWSPDGKHLAFSVNDGSTFSLWMLSLDDRKAERFGNVESSAPIEPVFSPDGRWLAYGSADLRSVGNSPSSGVFIQPFPATGSRYQVPKQQVDFHPLWSPNGRHLFYIPSAASGRIDVVPVATGPGVTFGTPENFPARVTADRLSGEMRAFDILPDGSLIGPISDAARETSATSGGTEFRVVLNWFEDLKQRVPMK
jgi:serine/threonine protein kinase